MGKVARGRPHACEVCLTSFERKGDLTRHLHIHEDIKPYRCNVCSKGFSQSSGLKTHMNIHSGNKPYRCSFGCASKFGDPSSCARHEKEIHRRVMPYQCPDPYCSSRIKRRSSFADHLKSKHGIDADVVDIDAFAPPLLPALAKSRRPRGKALKLITDISIANDYKEQSFDLNGGLSSPCSESPSPVDSLPRTPNMLNDFQAPIYSEGFDDFFETKPLRPLDSSVDFTSPEQFLQYPIWAPRFPFSFGAKSNEQLETPSIGHFNAPVPYAHCTTATRDVAFDMNSFSFGLGRDRVDLSDYSFMGAIKSWS